MHGFKFRIIAFEKLGDSTTIEEVQDLYYNGVIERNLESPPTKDTVQIPDGGFVIIRFKATNPGYWIFHCHLEDHVQSGMAMVIKVGEHDDMPPVPKNFPTCNNYF